MNACIIPGLFLCVMDPDDTFEKGALDLNGLIHSHPAALSSTYGNILMTKLYF